jgi:hypothetical protein
MFGFLFLAIHSTLAKISLSGSDYMETLLKDVDYDNIPALLGGGFQLYNEPFTFDGGASKFFFSSSSSSW